MEVCILHVRIDICLYVCSSLCVLRLYVYVYVLMRVTSYALSPTRLHSYAADDRSRQHGAARGNRRAGRGHVCVLRTRVCTVRACWLWHAERVFPTSVEVTQSGKTQRAWTAPCRGLTYQPGRIEKRAIRWDSRILQSLVRCSKMLRIQRKNLLK